MCHATCVYLNFVISDVLMVYAGLSQSCLFLEISSPMHTCPASKNTSISYKLQMATVITAYDEVL